MRLDSDVKEIVTRMFFNGFEFTNKDLDFWFKRAFVNRYYHMQIDFQTVETFASHVVSHTLMIEKELTFLYENFEKIAKGHSDSTTTQDTGRISQARDANATLPQDQLNLNFDNMDMRSADDNQIHKSKEDSTTNSQTQSDRFDPSTFKQLQHLLEEYLITYDQFFYQL